MKSKGLKLGITLGLFVVIIIYMESVQNDRFQQRKADMIAEMTSDITEKEIYQIYIFGKDGNISSDFNRQVDKIHRKYGQIIKNVTMMPYSENTKYPNYLDIKEYPAIIVLDAEGEVNRSSSPNDLEKFLSLKIDKK